jgi:magnesium-transporting ATPase (P-type)
VGDIVLLSAGEMIPADGLLIAGSLRSDQSAMTGENREIEKHPSHDAHLEPSAPSALFRGCTITAGSGEMRVTAVGDASFLGEISREIQLEQRESPLKIRLSKLARQISRLGYIAAVLVALASLFNAFFIDSGMQAEIIRLKITSPAYLFEQLLHAFTLGLTVIANIILGNLTGIPDIAALPPLAGVILVGISMALTLIAGIIPSRIASRNDPVVALRTE